MKFKNILALSPHTDDIEIGCGGTLSRFKKDGSSIYVVNFSLSKEAQEISKKSKNEFIQSMNILGADFEMLNLDCRNLEKDRQFILDYLIKISQKINFDVIFCHSSDDEHQDHKTIRNEAFRAFKDKTILGYELPWNCYNFSTDLFITIEQEHLQKKIDMIKCYKSQSSKKFMSEEYIKSLAKVRGIQIKKDYAECFEVIRGVI